MEGVVHNVGMLKAQDGTELYYEKNIIEQSKATILIIHGFAEHLGRYGAVVEGLNDLGYSLYRFDLRGHGKSQGNRGYVQDFNHLVEDTDRFVEQIKHDHPEEPIYMLGHSMGGFVAALYGIKYGHKLKGQILSGAATSEPFAMERMTKMIVNLLSYIHPNFRVQNKLSKHLCHDEDVVKAYGDDPLTLNDASVKLHKEMFIKGIKYLNRYLKTYKLPCLVLHGEQDMIIPKEASINFYGHIGSEDKELKIYDGLYHEILNEKERHEILGDINKWIEKRNHTS